MVRRVLAVCLTCSAVAGAADLLAPPLSLPAHPRLILNASRVAALKDQIAAAGQNPDLIGLWYDATAHWTWLKSQPVQSATATAGLVTAFSSSGDLLQYSENARDALLTSALLHLLRTNASDWSFLDRAIAEAAQVCVAWPVWDTTPRSYTLGQGTAMTGAVSCSLRALAGAPAARFN